MNLHIIYNTIFKKCKVNYTIYTLEIYAQKCTHIMGVRHRLDRRFYTHFVGVFAPVK